MIRHVELRPSGSICAVTGALTIVLLDSALLTSWEPAFDEPLDDDLGGHPQQVIELLEANEAFVSASVKVGKGRALVLELEGTSGEGELYELPGGAFVLVEPTLSWWIDNFPAKALDIQSLFTHAFDTSAKAAKVGTLVVPSGKLALFDSNADLTPAARASAKALAHGKVGPFGRDGDGGLLGLRAGTYSVRRRVITPRWAEKQQLVVAYLEAPKSSRPAAKVQGDVTATVALPKSATRKTAKLAPKPATPTPRKRSSVVFEPSPELAAIVGGTGTLTLREVHEKIDAYIDKHKLKKPKRAFVIYPDAKLGKVLGTEPISTFLISRPVNKHLTRRR